MVPKVDHIRRRGRLRQHVDQCPSSVEEPRVHGRMDGGFQGGIGIGYLTGTQQRLSKSPVSLDRTRLLPLD